MKKLLVLFLLPAVAACSSNGYKKAEDAQDAGREFIRASLDGDYKRARMYLLNDPDNLALITKQETNYNQMNDHEKSEYKDASIHPISIKKESDSVTSYTYYQSSNVKDTTTIRVVKVKDEWLVDLKSLIKTQ